jgi:YidC/Oxa1 family membrane protein insertase
MILQQLMLAAVVFLGFQLMCNRPQTADPRTADQIFGSIDNPKAGEPPQVGVNETRDATKGSMAWASSELRYLTAGTLNGKYQDKLKTAFDAIKDPVQKKLHQPELDEKLLAGDILVADAHYKFVLKHGEQLADANALRQVYMSIQGWRIKYKDSPLWEHEFKVPQSALNPSRFPWTSWTPKSMSDRLTAELSVKSKDALVYGLFPGYKIIDALVNFTGANPSFSYAFAAFLLALCVRALVFPLAQRQLLWGRKMQQLAPLIKEIREQYTDKKTKQVTNQVELQQKTMELYQSYGINPLAGCLPAFVQFPLFITVYQFMLNYQFAFEKGTFLWVNASTSRATHGFFAANLGQRDTLLIILYGITMVISTLLTPASDPTQAKQQKLIGVGMGLLFTFFMFTGAFPTPAAFVLYWVFTNLLATTQSLWVYRMPMPPLEKVNTKTGGVFPMPPFSKDPSPTNGKGSGIISSSPKSTGTPAKHKPKKRK